VHVDAYSSRGCVRSGLTSTTKPVQRPLTQRTRTMDVQWTRWTQCLHAEASHAWRDSLPAPIAACSKVSGRARRRGRLRHWGACARRSPLAATSTSSVITDVEARERMAVLSDADARNPAGQPRRQRHRPTRRRPQAPSDRALTHSQSTSSTGSTSGLQGVRWLRGRQR
jgi:hypothetical protein